MAQKHLKRLTAIATIVGSFILPPFGILLVPFLAVLVTELILHKDGKKALKIGFATIIGFLGGSIAKVLNSIANDRLVHSRCNFLKLEIGCYGNKEAVLAIPNAEPSPCLLCDRIVNWLKQTMNI